MSGRLHARVASRAGDMTAIGCGLPIMPLTIITTTWPLLLGMGVLMLGAGLQSTVLGLRATLEGFPTPVTGAIMSCYYVGYLTGTVAAPRMLRQIGHIRVFAALAAVASAAALVQALFVHPLAWGAMRATSGLCFAGIYVVAESWLNDRASRANRGRLLAVYMLVLYVGLGSAQFLLIPSNPSTPAPFMLVSALICLAMVPIVSVRRARHRNWRCRAKCAIATCIEIRRSRRRGRGRHLRPDLSHHFLDGSGVCPPERHGDGRCRHVHGAEHLRRGADAVPDWPAVRSHRSAHGDRRHLYRGHAAGGQHCAVRLACHTCCSWRSRRCSAASC